MRFISRLAPALLLAVSAAGAQQQPPIHQLGTVSAKSTETFGNIAGVRQLPGGRVLVNDILRRRVVMLDSTLALVSVVADSTSSTANAYGGRAGGLIAYKGDSTLFVDAASLSMLVIDPSGKIGRVISVPRSQDAMALTGVTFGVPGFDASGKLVYRAPPELKMPPMKMGTDGRPIITPPEQPDSAAIVRIDLATRKIDTVGFIKVQKVKMNVTNDNGRITMQTEVNPLPVTDDWAVLSDGTVAFIRGQDYHVDLLKPDGSRVSAGKVPFDWQRLSDEDKIAFIDSVKAQRARAEANGQAGQTAVGDQVRAQLGGRGSATPGPGGSTQVMIFGGDGGGRGGAAPQFNIPQPTIVSPSELPDYKPPFLPSSMRADADGNLWVRTVPTRKIEGGPVYDVINNKGELVERVQIPAGRLIVGFGQGGVVYLSTSDASGRMLEKAKAR